VSSGLDIQSIKSVRQRLRYAGRLLELAQRHVPGMSGMALVSSGNFDLIVDLVNSKENEALYLPRTYGFVMKVCNISIIAALLGKLFYLFN